MAGINGRTAAGHSLDRCTLKAPCF